MNKKNALLSFPCLLLLLSACGGNKKTSETTSADPFESAESVSKSDEGSAESNDEASETDSDEGSRYKVDEALWRSTLGSVESFSLVRACKKEGGDSLLSVLMDDDCARVVELFCKEESDAAEQKAERFYTSSVDGEYKRYVYDETTSSYAVETLSGQSPCFEEKEKLFSFLSSSYSSFEFLDAKNGYCAYDLSEAGEEGIKNILICFNKGEISSISFQTGDENGEDFSFVTILDINSISVDLPVKEKTSESVWEKAFASASSEFNFAYRCSYSYSGEYYSYSTEENYLCQGNLIEYRYGQTYDGATSSSHCYYSLEDGECFEYSSSDDEATWSKAKASLDAFADIKATLNLFASSWSSFIFDEDSLSYKASSLVLNETEYENVEVSFSDSELASIKYENEGYSCAFLDFGKSSVVLPKIA